MVQFVPNRVKAMSVWAWMIFWVAANAALGQDCLETCECHPLSEGISIDVSQATGCAPFGTELISDVDSSLWAGYAFEWSVTGGAYTWQSGSNAGTPSPAILLEQAGGYQFALTVTDTSGAGCSATSGLMTLIVAGAPQVMISEVPELCAWEEGVVEVLVNPGNTALTSFAWGTGGEWDTLAFPAPLTQVFEVAGENAVIAAVSNACGSAQDTAYVQVHPTPALEVHSDYNWFCMGSYAEFTASGDGDFIWNSNSELLSGGQPGDSTARFAVGSQVVGSVFTTIDHGTVQCTSSAGFTAYGFFVPSVTIGADAVSCLGNEVDMQANIFSFGWDTSVEWMLDGAPIDTVHAPTASQSTTSPFTWEGVTTPGNYEIQAAVTFDPYPAWLPNYGCADTTSFVVEVAALPEVNTAPTWEVCNQSFVEALPDAVPEGGAWEGPNGSVQSGVDPTAYGLGEHLFTYTFTDANGCQSQDTTVLSVEEPVQAIAGFDSTFCESNAIVTIPTAQAGGWWSGPGVLFPESGVIDLGELAVGENALVYHLGAGSCATSDEAVWNVLESPMAFIASDGSLFCDGDTVWFEVFAGSGTLAEGSAYQLDWTEQVLFTDSGAAFYVASIEEPLETIGLIVTDDAGCTDEAVTFVNPMPLPEVTMPELGVECAQDFAVELPQVSTSSGAWSGAGITDPVGLFNPAIAGLGATELTFTATSVMGCERAVSATIEVAEAPVIDAGDAIFACEGTSPVAVEGYFPADGWWEGPLSTLADTVVFDPAVTGAGSHEAVYHFGEGSCYVSDVLEIEVEALPVLQPVFETAICAGDTASLHVDVLNANSLVGYDVLWSGENLVLGSDPWSVLSGPWSSGEAPAAEVWVTSGSGCTASAVTTWSVNDLPELTVPESWLVCSNEETANLPSALPSGGTWSGNGVVGDAFYPANAGGTTADLAYAYEDANGCVNSTALLAEIVTPVELDLGPKLHACEGAGVALLPTPDGLSGFWSGPGLLDAVAGEVDLNALTPAAYTYVFTHEGVVCTVTEEVEMEVHPKPDVQPASSPVACADSLLTLTATVGAGTTPFSFEWEIGGEIVSTETPTYTAIVNQPGIIGVTLEATDAWGCSNSATWTAEVEAPVLVSLTTEMEVCNQAMPVDLMEAVEPGSSGVSLFYGLEAASAAVNASGLLSPEMLPVGSHEVVYQFDPSEGCAFRDTITLNVQEAIEVQAGADVSACLGSGAVELPAENGAMPVMWSAWTELAAAAIVNAETGMLDASQLPEGLHTFEVSSGDGTCASSDTLVLEIVGLPQVELPELESVCSNASPLGLPEVWSGGGTWEGAGVVDNVFDPQLSGLGAHSLTYGFIDAVTTCANEATATVLVHAPIEPQISEPGLACVDASVALELVDSSAFAQSQWFVSEAGEDMEPIANWIPDAAGIWTLTVETTDANGCAGSASEEVNVQSLPQTELLVSEAVGCSPLTVQLSTAEVLDVVNLNWFVNGAIAGADAALEAVLLAEDAAATHAVELQAEHVCGSVSWTDSVTVIPSPQFDFSNTLADACTGQGATIEVATSFADDVEWTSPDGVLTTGASLEFLSDAAGSVSYDLTATHSVTGCAASATWDITVHEVDDLTLVPSASTGCSPFEVDVWVEGWQGSELTWSMGDSILNQNGATVTLILQEGGLQEITAVAMDQWGCIGEVTQTIEVMPAPEVDWTLDDAAWCGVPAVVPVAVEVSDAEVHWNVNGMLMAIGQSAELEIAEAGWHAIEAVVTNGFGCMQSVTDSIETLPLPAAALSAEPMVGCSPLEVALNFEYDAVAANVLLSSAQGQWPLSVADSVLVLEEPGAYQIALNVTDERGCENTVELGDSIQVLPSPTVDFEPSPYAGTWDNPDPLNSSWSFENLSDAGQALWDFGDGGMSTNWNGSHTYDVPGVYEVHVMVVNAFGCSGEAMMEVEVEENLQVFVPNAFTPPTNGYSDGVNDGWRPEISAPELVDRYWLRVFNRYGQLIWETNNPEAFWVGEAQQGGDHFGMNDTYTWVLRVESRAQIPAQQEWRGHVTLIR